MTARKAETTTNRTELDATLNKLQRWEKTSEVYQEMCAKATEKYVAGVAAAAAKRKAAEA